MRKRAVVGAALGVLSAMGFACRFVEANAPRVRIPIEGIVGEVALREAREFEQTISAVRAAVAARIYPATPEGERPWVCVEAMFDDRAIVSSKGEYWAYPYSITDAYEVTVADPVRVVRDWREVKAAMREALGAGLFVEAAPGDTTGTRFVARVIRAGMSGNRNYYSDAVLREATPLFDGARVFVKGDAEHIKGGGKDLRNLVGRLVEPRFVEGAAADTGEIIAVLELIDAADPVSVKVREAVAKRMQDLFGLSIDADGTVKAEMREGKRTRVATSIKRVNSVDLIVEPGAGGGLVSFVEAANEDDEESGMNKKQKMRLLEAIQERRPAVGKLIDIETISDDDLLEHYTEAMAGAAPASGAVSNEDVAKMFAQGQARIYAGTAIATSRLPAKAQERLQKQFGAQASFTEAQVDEAIKAEREYLASFVESGRVQLGGLGDIRVEDRSAKIADMLDAFFDPAHNDHRNVQSFKECYVEITGDKRVTGRLEDMDRTRLAESLGRFAEAIDSTTFANALGSTLTRRMQAHYLGNTDLQSWRRVATTTPVGDFRTQERVRIGGYGNLPAVAQGDPYGPLASPGDAKASYAVTKRGGTESVTLEAIKNDDVGAIRRIPVELALAAGNTLYEFVFDFFRANAVIYDGLALYHATHGNLFTAAFSAAEFAAHRLAMQKTTRAGSLKRLATSPERLLVPFELQEAAYNAFVRNQNLDKTFVQTINPEVIPVSYWTDANDWVTVAAPEKLPVIEIGFLDGREEPELFVQDMPNVGSMFSNDKLTYKIRHIYSGTVLVDGEKGTTKAVVA